METELVELCPICIENPAEYYTECGHCYCIGCLCRITKCSMCRNQLLRAKLCIQIKKNTKNITTQIFVENNIYSRMEYSTTQMEYRTPLIDWNYNLLNIMSGMSGITYSN